jgi:hypothetical protein
VDNRWLEFSTELPRRLQLDSIERDSPDRSNEPTRLATSITTPRASFGEASSWRGGLPSDNSWRSFVSRHVLSGRESFDRVRSECSVIVDLWPQIRRRGRITAMV